MKRVFLPLGISVCHLLVGSPVFGQDSASFSFGTLRQKARELAQSEYKQEAGPELPDYLKMLSYDDFQRIRFRPGKGPWDGEGLRFSFQFFHRGFIYHDPVRVHLVEQGKVREFKFNPDQFDYGRNHFPQPVPSDLRFAGLRVLYPMNSPGKQDEVAAFLGASYFRVIGARQQYGASFRGLAIDTAEPTGEEFPRFTDFWIQKPGPSDTSVTLYALLDSPSVAGAYRLIIHPGNATRVEVQTSLFFRKVPAKLGLAPITSMFLMGENRTRYLPDFRPEVHDSDGLLIQSNAERCSWRPLMNPEKQPLVSRFPQNTFVGFGLLQRDRQFCHYQDLAGRYELRPSLWVQPREGFGGGTIELVEIPTPNEYNDNIVAYCVPREKPARGQEFQCGYELSACLSEPETCKLLRVVATRIAPEHDKSPTRFVIDFNAKDLPSVAADSPVAATVWASRGKVKNLVTEKNEVTGGWRAFFDLADLGKDAAELSLYLHVGNRVLSETWLYHYQLP